MPREAVVLTATDKVKNDLASNKALEQDSEAQMPAYGKDNGLTLAMLRGKDYDDDMWDELLEQNTFEEQSYLITHVQMTTVVIASVGMPDTKEADGTTG